MNALDRQLPCALVMLCPHARLYVRYDYEQWSRTNVGYICATCGPVGLYRNRAA